MDSYYVNENAIVEGGVAIGDDSRIYHFSHIRSGVKIGSQCIIGGHVYIDSDVHIGDKCKIQSGVQIFHGVSIGAGVFIGPGARFANDKLPRAINPDGSLKGADDWEVSPTFVDTGASIGMGAIVLPGVRIGKWAMVGAGSVVTKDIPDYGLVVGNPARMRGFVCRCGDILSEIGGAFVCPACDRRYKLVDSKLQPLDDE